MPEPTTASEALTLAALHDAYDLLFEFQQTINNMEGDHPQAEPVEKWLSFYEETFAVREAA